MTNGTSPALPPKGIYTGIHPTTIPNSVAILIQVPLTLAVDAKLRGAGSGPVSHHGNVRGEAKGIYTGIHPTTIPSSIAVLIQVPLTLR